MSVGEGAPSKREHADVGPAGTENFTFLCGPEAPCFTACCADLNLLLTPYDVLRMKKRLGLSAGEFLGEYTAPFEEEFVFPLICLKMRDDERRSCPFVTRADARYMRTVRAHAGSILWEGPQTSEGPGKRKGPSIFSSRNRTASVFRTGRSGRWRNGFGTRGRDFTMK